MKLKPTKKISPPEAKAILSRNDSDLKTLEEAGLPRIGLVGILALAVNRTFEIPKHTIEELRRRPKTLAQTRDILEALPDAAGRNHLKPMAAWYRSAAARASVEIPKVLKRKDHDRNVTIAVDGVIRFQPNFNRWDALGRVFADVFIEAGVPPKDAEHLNGDSLRKIADRLRDCRGTTHA